MSLGKKLERLDRKVDNVLLRSTTPAYPTADRLEIIDPGDDAVWIPAREVDVTWNLLGDVTRPLEVTLVRQTGGGPGTNFGRLAFFLLASGVDPAKKKVTIEVPDVPAGSDYAISVSNGDPLTVYSQPITIAEPA